jgi:hypothetical protein
VAGRRFGAAVLMAMLSLAVTRLTAGCSNDDDTGGASVDSSNPTAAEIVEELAGAGLPIEDVTIYDESTDPNELLGRPGQYTSKAGFSDARIGPDEFGDEPDPTEQIVIDVEAFDSDEARDNRADYLDGFADNSLLGGWYQYVEGNAILRVTFDLTPDQAADYEDAFGAIFN